MNLRFQACVVSSLVVVAASMALPSPAQGLACDVNTFLVQPPASTTWTLGPQHDDAPPRLALKTAPRL